MTHTENKQRESEKIKLNNIQYLEEENRFLIQQIRNIRERMEENCDFINSNPDQVLKKEKKTHLCETQQKFCTQLRHQETESQTLSQATPCGKRNMVPAEQKNEIELLWNTLIKYEKEKFCLIQTVKNLRQELKDLSKLAPNKTQQLREKQINVKKNNKSEDDQIDQINIIHNKLARIEAKIDLQTAKDDAQIFNVKNYISCAIKKETTNAIRQISSIIAMQTFFNNGEILNINTEQQSWPISPDFSLFLIKTIKFNDYDLIIEFGSGFSTVLIAKCLATKELLCENQKKTKFFSFEHLQKYFQKTLAQIEHEKLSKNVQLHYSTLQEYLAPDKKIYKFYECIDVLKEISFGKQSTNLKILVVVDGPPSDTGLKARYPAGPIVFEIFPGAKIDILIDDYNRKDEKDIVNTWMKDLRNARCAYSIEEFELEKGACLIKVNN